MTHKANSRTCICGNYSKQMYFNNAYNLAKIYDDLLALTDHIHLLPDHIGPTLRTYSQVYLITDHIGPTLKFSYILGITDHIRNDHDTLRSHSLTLQFPGRTYSLFSSSEYFKKV